MHLASQIIIVMTTVCLFGGRHDLPENQGAMCIDFNFQTMIPTWSTLAIKIFSTFLKEESENREDVLIYCTGLTPAAISLAMKFRDMSQYVDEKYHEGDRWYHGKVSFMHYNRETGQYVEQVVLRPE